MAEVDRQGVLDDLTKKAKTLEAVLDLLASLGYIPKRQRVKRQVIYKTKFVVRRARTKKAAEENETAGAPEQSTTI